MVMLVDLIIILVTTLDHGLVLIHILHPTLSLTRDHHQDKCLVTKKI